ncbi:hypothetical protein HPGCJGGD_2575 [Methylobacterium haplocladii]|nr:hypothetical protein HPGCJGGD_2575 [Methylobacterium haplocladii]
MSAARTPSSPALVMVAPLTTSAVAERAMRLVAIRPPMLRDAAVVTVPALPPTAGLPRTLRASLSALCRASAFARSARVCSGVRVVTVLLTVAFTVPALAAFRPTRPALAVTMAASTRARIDCVAATVKKPVPSTVSRAMPTILSASLSVPVTPSAL